MRRGDAQQREPRTGGSEVGLVAHFFFRMNAVGELHARLWALLEPAIGMLGCELVAVEYGAQGARPVLRIYIDKEGGVTVDDCERVSHQVSGVLDVEDPIAGGYALEVSSPGLDRPLCRPEHFARFAGSVARLRLVAPRNGRRNFKGRLCGVHDGQVVLEVDGERVMLPLADIERARLVPDIA